MRSPHRPLDRSAPYSTKRSPAGRLIMGSGNSSDELDDFHVLRASAASCGGLCALGSHPKWPPSCTVRSHSM